jgi:hypothetical protein
MAQPTAPAGAEGTLPALLRQRWGGDAPHAAPLDAVLARATLTEPLSLAPSRSAEQVAACAVSLAFLIDFYEQCVAPLEALDGAPLCTKAVVERVVKPGTAHALCALTQLLPAVDVAPPSAFVSHAWGNPFALLLSALREHFQGAIAAEVFVWIDAFAVNQHAPSEDLHQGRALARTIDVSAATLVVLDSGALPLTRLWCLFEIGSTPPEKLLLLMHGFSETDVASAFRAVDVQAAECFDSTDTNRIREHITVKHGTQAAFQQVLKLRLLLKPTSYEADRAVLLAHSAGDV